MQKTKQVGTFTLSDDLVESPEASELLSALRFVPLRVEHLYSLCGFEYVGYSPYFPVVSEGSLIPRYRIQMDKKSPMTEIVIFSESDSAIVQRVKFMSQEPVVPLEIMLAVPGFGNGRTKNVGIFIPDEEADV